MTPDALFWQLADELMADAARWRALLREGVAAAGS